MNYVKCGGIYVFYTALAFTVVQKQQQHHRIHTPLAYSLALLRSIIYTLHSSPVHHPRAAVLHCVGMGGIVIYFLRLIVVFDT